jgi:hypothetical protein
MKLIRTISRLGALPKQQRGDPLGALQTDGPSAPSSRPYVVGRARSFSTRGRTLSRSLRRLPKAMRAAEPFAHVTRVHVVSFDGDMTFILALLSQSNNNAGL